MIPEQNRSECVLCREPEPSIIHTVNKTGVSRGYCTDCLLKVYRELFCSVCFNVFDDDALPPQDRMACLNCPSTIHISCSPQPPSSSAASSSSSAPPPTFSFICPPCSDPNFTFFPRVNDDVPETPLTDMALIAAAKIRVAIMNHAVARLKDEAYKKIVAAGNAKLKARVALENLQDIVIRERASPNTTPSKRKNDGI